MNGDCHNPFLLRPSHTDQYAPNAVILRQKLLLLITLKFTASYKHMRSKILPLKEDKTYLCVSGYTL